MLLGMLVAALAHAQDGAAPEIPNYEPVPVPDPVDGRPPASAGDRPSVLPQSSAPGSAGADGLLGGSEPAGGTPSEADPLTGVYDRLDALEAAQAGGGQQFPGLLNPSISFNGLFLGSAEWDDGVLASPHLGGEAGEPASPGFGETYGTGLNVQEMELQLQSVVDPYFKANVVLSIPGTEGLEIEEGYVTLTSIPRLLVNVGKIKEPFGRENATHTHALLTIDKSLIGQRVFGGEGLNDVAVNAAFLLPVPWFSELTVGVDRGANEIVLDSGEPLGLGAMLHWKNQLDLAYNTSVEIGVSGLAGQGAATEPFTDDHATNEVGGVDVTLKSHGAGAHQFRRLVWQSEYLAMHRPWATSDEELGGLYSTLEVSLGRRFWIGGRYDLVGLPAPALGGTTMGGTGILVFAPTEFSAFRVQGQRQWTDDGRTVDTVTSQLDFTIGAHPAHAY